MPVTYFDGRKNTPISDLSAWRIPADDAVRIGQGVLTAAVPFLSRGVIMRADALTAIPWSIRNAKDEDVWTSDDAAPPDDLKWLGNLTELLHRIEASLTVTSTAYLFKERNRARLLDLRFLSPDTTAPVWDMAAGLTHFERGVLGRQRFAVDDIVYFWHKGLHETEPRPSPAANAANAAGILYSMDAYTKAYFDRGAVRATLLTYEGAPPPEADRQKLKNWWKRAVGGIKNAFASEVISAAIKPVQIGDGIGDMGNVPLTEEKRQDVGTALGIPLSLLLANAANYATAQADRRNFYEITVIPEADLIARTMNKQLLEKLGLSLVFRPEAMSIFQADEAERAQAFSSYTGGGLKPSVAAQLLGITLPEGIEYADLDPEPQPEPLANAAEPGQAMDEEEETPANDEAKRVELERFHRWSAKRANPDVTKFVSDLLTHEEKLHAIGQCSGDHEEAVKAYPVIDWQGEGVDNYRAMKAMVLQLDPDDDEAEQAIRRSLEKKIEAGLNDGFREMIEEVLPDGYIYWKDPSAAADLIRGSWKLNERMEAELRKALYESVSLGVEVSLDMMDQVGMSFDYTMVMDEALEWAKNYSYELIGDLNTSGREIVSRAIARHIEGGKPMGALVDDLMKLYGEQRARMIASTETTRAFFQGQVTSLRATGVVETMEWRTSRDHLVCPICGPMNHKRAPLGKMFENNRQPPAHPRCRCWIAPVIDRSKLQ
jgi:SPP1 gp7 family putative phage head morphogenesis protein